MRIRIRGPLGSSAISLSNTATLSDLLAQITEKTSLQACDIKSGYPPKPLALEQYDVSATLSDLGLGWLDGEQLTVVAKESARPLQNMNSAGPIRNTQTMPQKRAPAVLGPVSLNTSTATQAPSQFSFAGVGTAPSATIESTTSSTPDDKSLLSTSVASTIKLPPLSVSREQNKPLEMDAPELPLPSHRSTVILRIMPDDNSCMFRAFGSACLGSVDCMNELRSLVAQTIQKHPSIYTEVVLEKKPDQYCRWIQNEDSWGGGIELSILSKHFDMEICSVDVKTLRVDKYNEGRPTRCILVYSGIHYDTIALSPSDPPFNNAYAPPEHDTKIFDSADDVILVRAIELCKVLQMANYYTDTAGFSIRCNDCGEKLRGEKAAAEHGSETGHWNFEEVT